MTTAAQPHRPIAVFVFCLIYLQQSFVNVFADMTLYEMQGSKFSSASQEDMRYLFQYLEVCLGKIVADIEVGALVQALSGGYVEPGPGGDPIRCALMVLV